LIVDRKIEQRDDILEQLDRFGATIGERVRNLKQHGFEEGVSTRLLIYAGELIRGGIDPRRSAQVGIVTAISDDTTVQQAVADIVDAILP